MFLLKSSIYIPLLWLVLHVDFFLTSYFVLFALLLCTFVVVALLCHVYKFDSLLVLWEITFLCCNFLNFKILCALSMEKSFQSNSMTFTGPIFCHLSLADEVVKAGNVSQSDDGYIPSRQPTVTEWWWSHSFPDFCAKHTHLFKQPFKISFYAAFQLLCKSRVSGALGLSYSQTKRH